VHNRKNFTVKLLAVLLICSVAWHIWLASRRLPVSPAVGYEINAPTQWKNEDQNPHLRVATYNIHRGKGTDHKRDLTRTAHILQGVDIAALNEVAGPSLFSPDQAERLGRILETGWLFAPNQTRWYRDYFGNALLSRYKVTLWFREQLLYDKRTSLSHRNLLTARIPFNGIDVTLFVTHLDRGVIRTEQLRYVLDKFRRCRPAVLMGDLNSSLVDSQLAEILSDPNNVDAVAVALGQTDHEGRIDWIITRGFKVVGGGTHSAGVSDHPYYWVELELDK
jgi:endonuclease/exonuclease/phosphatase family metal-dependent hydrolase